jgi:hypothetical protein
MIRSAWVCRASGAEQEARVVYEVNVFDTLTVQRTVLPVMRR